MLVVAGAAWVKVGDEAAEVRAGGLALVPAGVPHEVCNRGEATLRFLAVYASTDVVSTYEQVVQPGGSREREPVA
jgi:mannose-6-phosphate isomerase-like protein (cupin superfamily)